METTKKIKSCTHGDGAVIGYPRLKSLFENCISDAGGIPETGNVEVTAHGLIFIIILTLILVAIMILCSGSAHAEPDLRFILDQEENTSGLHGSQSSRQNHTAGSTWTEPVTGMEFVWVPGGCFQMGSNSSDADSDEHPVHKVCVDGFWIGKYEVTQGQWQRIMHNNPSDYKAGDNYPVEEVSWNDAKKFISRLNKESGHEFALPTEAQWEYAAKSGGKNQKYSGGDNPDRFAWYSSNSRTHGSLINIVSLGILSSHRHSHPVGTKAPNGLGIYDMSGNVWEWCEDIYVEDAYSKYSLNNPVVETGGSNRVNRGGSWCGNSWFVRCAYRGRNLASGTRDDLGFRLIRKN